MSSLESYGVSPQNIGQFDAGKLMPEGQELDDRVRGGLKGFLRTTLEASPGLAIVRPNTAHDLVAAIADYEAAQPMAHGQPFRYPAVSDLHEGATPATANLTVASAIANMQLLTGRFGAESFASAYAGRRKIRALTWQAPIDEDYAIRVRGGSGASAFSIDFGLGFIDRSKPSPTYKELWRAGVDTAHTEDGLGARFIRTGSGIKHGDEQKHAMFKDFRRRYGAMPQRLLGLVGLYFMRELEPDYAVALSTGGAQKLSTLKKSSGSCDYSGIFGSIGFTEGPDPNWLQLPSFETGFYEALEQARIGRRESHILARTVEAINQAPGFDNKQRAAREPLIKLCSDNRTATIEREVAVALAR